MTEIWAPTYGAQARDLELGGSAAAGAAHTQLEQRIHGQKVGHCHCIVYSSFR